MNKGSTTSKKLSKKKLLVSSNIASVIKKESKKASKVHAKGSCSTGAMVNKSCSGGLKSVASQSRVANIKQGHNLQQPVHRGIVEAGKVGLSTILTDAFIDQRGKCNPRESYTAHLVQSGPSEIARTLVDEAVQIAQGVSSRASAEQILSKATDVHFNLATLLRQFKLSMKDVTNETVSRIIESGYKTEVFKKLRDGTLHEQDVLAYISASSGLAPKSLASSKLKVKKLKKPSLVKLKKNKLSKLSVVQERKLANG